MPRYIDADALGIGKAFRYAFEHPEYADGWNSAIEIINSAPTADVVEVVRCKECRHSALTSIDGVLYCFRVHNTLKCDDFCSYGERKEEP